MHDITKRLIDSYQLLRKEKKVRSARQFALSIDTYPQSFNDILKGRREATLSMIHGAVRAYPLNAHYLLTGEGLILRSEVFGVSTDPVEVVRYFQAHEFPAFVAEYLHGGDITTGTNWQLPQELIGQHIDIAIQCNNDHLSDCLRIGDILFLRKLPRPSWTSSLSSKKVYTIIYRDTFRLVRMTNNDSEGIYIKPNEDIQNEYVRFSHIECIWSVASYLSVHSTPKHHSRNEINTLYELIGEHKESIQLLKLAITELQSHPVTTH